MRYRRADGDAPMRGGCPSKESAAVPRKAEMHERAKTKEKDDAARQKQEARRAIEEDKARRREAEERKRAAKAAASM